MHFEIGPFLAVTLCFVALCIAGGLREQTRRKIVTVVRSTQKNGTVTMAQLAGRITGLAKRRSSDHLPEVAEVTVVTEPEAPQGAPTLPEEFQS